MTNAALALLDSAIADLEGRLGLNPGESLKSGESSAEPKKEKKEKKKKPPKQQQPAKPVANNPNQPDICKLEFKVGVITNVWEHPEADKLYCEEIDVGEASGPRQIASGLRPYFTLEQMKGQRLLVVANLKAKNLVKFKSHGMVLCADNGLEGDERRVEFVEPPADAPIGEVVSFDGLPTPEPWSAAQVDKRKVFQACMEGLKTLEDCTAAWNGHAFTTTAGPCKVKTIANGPMK